MYLKGVVLASCLTVLASCSGTNEEYPTESEVLTALINSPDNAGLIDRAKIDHLTCAHKGKIVACAFTANDAQREATFSKDVDGYWRYVIPHKDIKD